MIQKPRSTDDIDREWDANEDSTLDDAQGSAPALSAIDAIVLFLDHFDFNGGGAELIRDVPDELLEQLADCFKVFESGRASLDRAFGGKTGRAQQRLRSMRKAWEVTGILLGEHMKLMLLSPDRRPKGTPMDVAMERTATNIGKSVEYVRKQYRATRPPW